MQKVSTILFQLLIVTILSFSAKASECYHYHTKKSYKVVQNNGKYFLQFTVKDPDGITFVSQENYLIGNVKTAISIVAQDDVSVLIKDKQFLYLLVKEIPYDKPLLAIKLFSLTSKITVKNARLIQSAGVWHYIVPNQYAKRGFDDVLLKKVPANFEVMYDFKRGNDANYLIKSNAGVAKLQVTIDYELNVYKYIPIPKLNPKTTTYTEVGNDGYQGFLLDKRNFFIVDYDLNYSDVTPQFASDKKSGYGKMQINSNDFHQPILSDGSATLWIYFKDGISLTNHTDVNFMPINASFVNLERTVMLSAGKCYTNGWAAANQVDPVDLTAVKDKLSLVELADVNYADNYFNYQLINNKLVTGQSVKKQVQGYPTIASYGAYTSAIVVEKGMLFWNENKTTKINSAVKSLVKAYAFDDKMLIENKLIPNLGN